MLIVPQLNATKFIDTESIESLESITPDQFPKSMAVDTTNFFGEEECSQIPDSPYMEQFDDEELMAAIASPPTSPIRSPSPVIDDDDEETQAIWAANIRSQDPPPAEEPTPPVDETPAAETPPTTAPTPFSFATTLSELTADITTNDQCSEIIKIATQLIASTRAHGKTLNSAIKKQARASITRVDGAPRQRAPRGSRPPTATGIYNVEKRVEAAEAYNNGRRAVKQPKTDNKASHIQNILAEFWRSETAETKAHYKALAAERAASMVSV